MLEKQEVSSEERRKLIEKLYGLTEELLEQLILTLNPPKGTMAGNSASIGEKVCKLIEYAESSAGWGLAVVSEELEKLCLENLFRDELGRRPEPEKQTEKNQKTIDNLTQESSIRAWLNNNLPPYYSPVEEKLGQSDWAIVFRAYDRQLNRDVAIKVLTNLAYKTDFIHNVQKAARISDKPYFMTIYDAFLDQYYPYYIMQFIEGKSLRQLIEESGKLPIKTVIKLCLAIGDALTNVQDKQFIHNNIKPSNILIVNQDEHYDLPFISPLCQPEKIHKCLQEIQGQYQEDLCYLIPEKFTEDYYDIIPAKADQYTLGLLMYELLTGKLPPCIWNGSKLEQKNRVELKSLTLAPISEKQANCPEILEKIIQRMTSLDPDERYDNLQEPLNAIRRLLNPYLNLAKESYNRCIKKEEENFFKTFYDLFRDKDEEIDRRFHRLDHEDNWPRQHQLLKEAILLLFVFYEQKEVDDPNILTRITNAHRNVPDSFYNHFVDALITTVCGDTQQNIQPFDPKCRDDNSYKQIIAKAWRNTLEPGIKYMKSKSQHL